MEEVEIKPKIRIYNWKLLLLSITEAGAVVYGILHYDGLSHLFIIVVAVFHIILNLSYSLTKSGNEEYLNSVEKQKKSAHERLGKFAFLDDSAPIVLLLAAWITSLWLPSWRWLIGLFLILALSLMVKSISKDVHNYYS